VATKTDRAPEDRPPIYDPAVHTDPAQEVFIELYCECGGILRQRDPVSYVKRGPLPAFLGRHIGAGHGPASKSDAVAAREKRREAAHVLAGEEYSPREYPNLDTTDTTVIPWPDLSTLTAPPETPEG
jgi:hypothetical protein